MDYHRKNDKKLKRTFRVILFFIFLFILLSFFSPQVNYFFTETLSKIGYPVYLIKNIISKYSTTFESIISSRKSLLEDKIQLEEDLLKYKIQSISFEALEEENEILRKMLGKEKNTNFIISAFVLSSPPESPYDTLVLDVGRKSGLKGGEIVIFENVLLGKIISLTDLTSKVKLLSQGGVETDAYISSIDLPIRVFGMGNGNFEANLPKDAAVKIGDVITLQTESSNILGQVGLIEDISTAYFKKILFRFPFSLQELRYVNIIKK